MTILTRCAYDVFRKNRDHFMNLENSNIQHNSSESYPETLATSSEPINICETPFQERINLAIHLHFSPIKITRREIKQRTGIDPSTLNRS